MKEKNRDKRKTSNDIDDEELILIYEYQLGRSCSKCPLRGLCG